MAETFGCTIKGGEISYYLDYIEACKFTSGSAGSLQSITVYIKYWNQNANVKCAIYDSSLNLLTNGETEENEMPTNIDDWVTFNFGASKPSVAASTEYWLCFWGNDYLKMYEAGGETDQKGRQAIVYNSWPDSLVPSEYLAKEVSIYATYEEAPPPAAKTLVQAALISIPPLIVLPTLHEILRFTQIF